MKTWIKCLIGSGTFFDLEIHISFPDQTQISILADRNFVDENSRWPTDDEIEGLILVTILEGVSRHPDEVLIEFPTPVAMSEEHPNRAWTPKSLLVYSD